MHNNLDSLGDVVSTLGSPEFGPTFYNMFARIFEIEECTVFSFHQENSPETVLIEGRCNSRLQAARQLAEDYMSGGYRYDPNVSRRSSTLAVYSAEADDICDNGFRQHYYDSAALAHELVILGQADDMLYYTSFYRKRDADQFRPNEIAAVGNLANFMVKSLHRHQALSHPSCSIEAPPTHASVRERTLEHLREVLLAGPHRLSPREAEICAGIVLGYSTLAISLNCSITPNTVATHRKRAYAKLGISSQNELFARYFNTVREFQGGRS